MNLGTIRKRVELIKVLVEQERDEPYILKELDILIDEIDDSLIVKNLKGRWSKDEENLYVRTASGRVGYECVEAYVSEDYPALAIRKVPHTWETRYDIYHRPSGRSIFSATSLGQASIIVDGYLSKLDLNRPGKDVINDKELMAKLREVAKMSCLSVREIREELKKEEV